MAGSHGSPHPNAGLCKFIKSFGTKCFPRKKNPSFLGISYDDVQSQEQPQTNLPSNRPQHSVQIERDSFDLVTEQAQRTSIPKPVNRERNPKPSLIPVPSRPSRPSTKRKMDDDKRHTHHPRLPAAINLTPSSRSTRQGSTVSNDGSAVSSSIDPRDLWTTSPFRESQLVGLFHVIQNTLSHVPYVICGLAALYDHGYRSRRVTSVSILCPAYAKDNVRGWLAARGYASYADSVSIPIVVDGGKLLCRVRIKYVDEGFDILEVEKGRLGPVNVLSLASQIDNAAAGYVDIWRRLRDRILHQMERKDREAARVAADEEALGSIARDVFWCLTEAVRRREQLQAKYMPSLLSEDFWIAFTAHYPNAKFEMERAGIDVKGISKKHETAISIREHNDMLRAFGHEIPHEESGEGVVNKQGPLENMRNLMNTRSVYSLNSPTLVAAPGEPSSRPPTASSLPVPVQQQQSSTSKSTGMNSSEPHAENWPLTDSFMKKPSSSPDDRPMAGNSRIPVRTSSSRGDRRGEIPPPPPPPRNPARTLTKPNPPKQESSEDKERPVTKWF
ncbi:uncharacterized protein F4822DRAFT_440324 [Hypoxylon trugodes]|uniref:uncharacterized protein n=1 Tax=Hypoxylon trugodes TaxID=326681 RepID=UPI00219BAE27|nr:uncharacterized protein F4822DRAFT_440324 [Hypoxylon trugodes]KAI1384201.1 hypothetical protein F4822DRAFT_440324 [Hypoxylon trugodes]